MKNTILYILGAGASCNVLPLSNNFSVKLIDFLQFLKNENLTSPMAQDFDDFTNLYEKDLEWLSSEASKHASVDTLAKKLFFKNDSINLNRLKSILTSYFLIQQGLQHVDMRYDSFLATILTKDNENLLRLPKNLKILTWNYDTQLEKAFYEFCNDEKQVMNEITSNENIIRINGYCGTNQSEIVEKFMWGYDKANIIEEGIKLHYDIYQNGNNNTLIRFAWEEETRNFCAKIDSLIDVSTVVVIGYSFPYFNREIDNFILLSLAEALATEKKKIYLQFPEGVHASVETRIRSSEMKNSIGDIIRISDTNMFYIPDEFFEF